ncbi:hypothetical protein A9507_11470 [Methanobacterium sp. A39]|uniref:Heparan-alpha-glucosaminide N-acetyltransferase catalytic domain-containing protein n=2 Tax=Methanobacteriaceae TaxID=2159 RepID=A0A2A2H3H3_METBR|nr:hypothetical protein A9507_11470 [Methanobacterium sp. A39]PAV03942.1 hypothetical protein ASJ80_02695 [Methanobacterium bryantii]
MIIYQFSIMELINNKIPKRFMSLDIARGIAVLLMVEAHIRFIVPVLSQWAYLFAAPSFIFISGVSYQLLIQSRQNKVRSSIYLEVLWRAVLLFLLTASVTLIGNLFLSRDVSIFIGDIFLIIAVGYIIGLLIKNSIKLKVITILLIYLLTFIITSYHIQSLLFLTGSIQILPGVCYFIVGQIAFEAYKNKNLNLKTSNKFLAYAAVFIAVNLGILYLIPYNFTIQGRDFFLEFLTISSIMTFITFLLLRTIDIENRFNKIFKPVRNLGRISLTGYYVSYVSFVVTGFFILKTNPIILNLSFFIFAVIALILLEKLWRPHKYILGFEWLLRRGTNMGVRFTEKIGKIQLQVKNRRV